MSNHDGSKNVKLRQTMGKKNREIGRLRAQVAALQERVKELESGEHPDYPWARRFQMYEADLALSVGQNETMRMTVELEEKKVEAAKREILKADCDCSGEGVGSLGGCFRCRALDALSTFGWDFRAISPSPAKCGRDSEGYCGLRDSHDCPPAVEKPCDHDTDGHRSGCTRGFANGCNCDHPAPCQHPPAVAPVESLTEDEGCGECGGKPEAARGHCCGENCSWFGCSCPCRFCDYQMRYGSWEPCPKCAPGEGEKS